MSITLPSSIVLVIDTNDVTPINIGMEYISPSGGNAQSCSAATSTNDERYALDAKCSGFANAWQFRTTSLAAMLSNISVYPTDACYMAYDAVFS